MDLAGLLKCQSFKTTLCFSHFSLSHYTFFFLFFFSGHINIYFPFPVWLNTEKKASYLLSTYSQANSNAQINPGLRILPQLKYLGCQGDVMTRPKNPTKEFPHRCLTVPSQAHQVQIILLMLACALGKLIKLLCNPTMSKTIFM